MGSQQKDAKNEKDKLSCCKNVNIVVPGEVNKNKTDVNREMSDASTLHKTENERKFYEDSFFTKNKKRAFTLGAIDGIGDISILKAPVINPKNAQIEPPILQLPSRNNLIKNVHIKVEQETNIDKSYKYRAQNSNRDIINNMKPLYSLPEKVVTYYMNQEKIEAEENQQEKNQQEEEAQQEEEEAQQKEEAQQEEENQQEEKSQEAQKKMEEFSKNTSADIKKKKKSDNKVLLTEECAITCECIKHDKPINGEKNIDLKNIDPSQTEMKKSVNTVDNEQLEKKQEAPAKTSEKMKCIMQNKVLQQNLNLGKKENKEQNTKMNACSVLPKQNEKIDEFENFKSNKIMSSTLTNALLILAGDIC